MKKLALLRVCQNLPSVGRRVKFRHALSLFFRLFFFWIAYCPLWAQDVETTIQNLQTRLEQEPVKFNGSIAASLLFNQVSGHDRRIDPLAGRLYANLNIDVLGVNIPLSAAVSSGSAVFNYQLPAYAFVGISPSYKWAALHLGDRSLQFSPYTLSGHSFFGTGLELKPGKFRFSAIYGRLRRARAEDYENPQNLEPAYRRMGWGIKTGYDNGRDRIAIMLFNGADRKNSIPFDTLNPAPRENTVLGLSSRKQFGKTVYLEIDYALSAYTRNQNSAVVKENISFLNKMGSLFTPRTSSGYYKALKTAIGFRTDFGDIQLQHERIDPGYRSLGTLFFNDDMENFTAGTTAALFQKKLNIAANLGVQRNDLSGKETNASVRFVGNITATVIPSPKLSLNAMYSNFSNTNRLKTLADPFNLVDSIILVLTNQNINVSVNYNLTRKNPSMLTALFSYQKANTIENDEVMRDRLTNYYLGNISHSYTLTGSKTTFTSSLLANYGVLPQIKTLSMAPTFSVNQSFFGGKLKAITSLSYVTILIKDAADSNIKTAQLRLAYALLKKHQLGFNFGVISRKSGRNGLEKDFTEFSGNISYNWSF